MTEAVDWFLAVPGDVGGLPQTDPSESLRGRKSSTEAQFLESALSAVSATPKHVFTDETQITGFGFPPPAPSGDPRTPAVDSGSYASSASLKHWWRLTYDPADESGGGDRGVDYGVDPIDFTSNHGSALGSGSQDITAPDNAPASMHVQRSSYPLSGSPNGMYRANQAWSSAGDEYTCAAWVYLTSSADPPSGNDPRTIFCLKPSHTASGKNDNDFLLLSLNDINGANNGRISYEVHADDYNVTSDRIRYVSDTVVALNAWHHVAARHRLSTQECDIFIDGVKETAYTLSEFDAGITRLDAGVLDAGFGAVRASFWTLAGNVHSIATWDDYLEDAEIADLAAMGDGDQLPDPVVLSPVGSWLCFQDGANENVAREVIGFDDSLGEFTVDGDLPNDAVASDVYRLWPPNGLFAAFTNVQSVSRSQRSRLLYMRNNSGSTMPTFRYYVQGIDPGPLVCEIAMGAKVGGELTVLGIQDEADEPALTRVSNFSMGLDGSERFGRPRTYALAEFDSPLELTLIGNGAFHATFIKLGFRQGEPIPLFKRCVFQVFADSGGGTIVGTMMIVVDVLGADEEMILGPDRRFRLLAGGRVQAIVRDRATGLPVPGKTVTISQTAGPGATTAQSSDVTDDTGLPVRATYISPTDPADVGQTVSHRVEVN
jgi:hypothetical protein